MKVIKKFEEFKYLGVPGPNEEGNVQINVNNDDLDLFKIEPDLNQLLRNDKITIVGNDIWYFEDDYETIKKLKDYFPLDKN